MILVLVHEAITTQRHLVVIRRANIYAPYPRRVDPYCLFVGRVYREFIVIIELVRFNAGLRVSRADSNIKTSCLSKGRPVLIADVVLKLP